MRPSSHATAAPVEVAPTATVTSAPAPPTLLHYEMRTGPIPPSPPHPRLNKRPPSPKRSRTSGPSESSNSWP